MQNNSDTVWIHSEAYLKRTKGMKANQTGAAMTIFLYEVCLNEEVGEKVREALSGSFKFWRSNREDINDLVSWLHENAALDDPHTNATA